MYFHTNYEIIYYSSLKNTVGSLIGIALNLLIALDSILIFYYIDSSDPRTWYISPSICVLFDVFHQCFIVFYIYRTFVSLSRYIPKYFVLFITMVKGIVSLISLSVFSLFSSVQSLSCVQLCATP